MKPLRILLAEDSLVNQRMAVGLLEKRGHQITIANDGRQAVAAAQKERFDLILMDVQMPEMDGFSATMAIREWEAAQGRRTPIVAMTAHAMKGDRERCLAAGMDHYISKPIRSQELFAAIEGLFNPTRAPKVVGPLPAAEADSRINWQAALATVGGDRRLLEEMVNMFLVEAPRLLAEARRSAADGDPAALRRSAHTLKASLRYIGAEMTAIRAGQLEQQATASDLANAGPRIDTLEQELQQIVPLLKAFLASSGGTANPAATPPA
jgi:CheY-like chemotaxis protein